MSDSPPTPRLDRALLVVALAVFLALGAAMTRAMMVFSEELIMLPTNVGRVTASSPGPDGRLRFEVGCRPGDLRVVLSGERPTLSLCVGARRFPIMAAPHFSGLFLWPIELFRFAHGDDPFAQRAMLLSLGALSIALTHRLVARLRGSRLAALSALGMAVSSCFVCLTSIVQNFETLPWVWLMAAGLLAVDAREPLDARGARRMVAAAACVGLSLLANVKAIFLLGPMALVAWRLGARVDALPTSLRRKMLVAAMVPLAPVLAPLAIDPSMRWSQGRGSNWRADLASNLARPEKVLEAARDLALEWGDFGRYLTRGAVDPLPTIAAACVCAFVLVDTARTLRRGRGCPVTAACGVALATYLAVVTLLYAEFPANYTPLHAVFGVAVGCAVDRLDGWLRPRAPALVRAAVAVAALAVFALGTARSQGAMAEVAFVTNSHAERALVRHLVDHPEPDGVTVTVNLLSGGVLDAISRARVRTVQAHPWLGACEHRARGADASPCFHDRWTSLLTGLSGHGPVRVVMPASLAFVGRPPRVLAAQRAQLDLAARELGMSVRVERVFTTPAGVPAAVLLRVAR